jgi:hypothetical protein
VPVRGLLLQTTPPQLLIVEPHAECIAKYYTLRKQIRRPPLQPD